MHGANDEAMSDLKFEYVKTDVNVFLGESKEIFNTPSIPLELKNFMTYNFQGGSNQFTLWVKEGAKYKISDSKDAQ